MSEHDATRAAALAREVDLLHVVAKEDAAELKKVKADLEDALARLSVAQRSAAAHKAENETLRDAVADTAHHELAQLSQQRLEIEAGFAEQQAEWEEERELLVFQAHEDMTTIKSLKAQLNDAARERDGAMHARDAALEAKAAAEEELALLSAHAQHLRESNQALADKAQALEDHVQDLESDNWAALFQRRAQGDHAALEDIKSRNAAAGLDERVQRAKLAQDAQNTTAGAITGNDAQPMGGFAVSRGSGPRDVPPLAPGYAVRPTPVSADADMNPREKRPSPDPSLSGSHLPSNAGASRPPLSARESPGARRDDVSPVNDAPPDAHPRNVSSSEGRKETRLRQALRSTSCSTTDDDVHSSRDRDGAGNHSPPTNASNGAAVPEQQDGGDVKELQGEGVGGRGVGTARSAESFVKTCDLQGIVATPQGPRPPAAERGIHSPLPLGPSPEDRPASFLTVRQLRELHRKQNAAAGGIIPESDADLGDHGDTSSDDSPPRAAGNSNGHVLQGEANGDSGSCAVADGPAGVISPHQPLEASPPVPSGRGAAAAADIVEGALFKRASTVHGERSSPGAPSPDGEGGSSVGARYGGLMSGMTALDPSALRTPVGRSDRDGRDAVGQGTDVAESAAFAARLASSPSTAAESMSVSPQGTLHSAPPPGLGLGDLSPRSQEQNDADGAEADGCLVDVSPATEASASARKAAGQASSTKKETPPPLQTSTSLPDPAQATERRLEGSYMESEPKSTARTAKPGELPTGPLRSTDASNQASPNAAQAPQGLLSPSATSIANDESPVTAGLTPRDTVSMAELDTAKAYAAAQRSASVDSDPPQRQGDAGSTAPTPPPFKAPTAAPTPAVSDIGAVGARAPYDQLHGAAPNTCIAGGVPQQEVDRGAQHGGVHENEAEARPQTTPLSVEAIYGEKGSGRERMYLVKYVEVSAEQWVLATLVAADCDALRKWEAMRLRHSGYGA